MDFMDFNSWETSLFDKYNGEQWSDADVTIICIYENETENKKDKEK